MEKTFLLLTEVPKRVYKNLMNGIVSITLPKLMQTTSVKPFYSTSNQERLRKDYKKSVIGIKNEVSAFERRFKVER